jgi:lipopolysaccharide transport system permease protein
MTAVPDARLPNRRDPAERVRGPAYGPIGFVARAGAAVIDVVEWRRLVWRLARAELRRENARLVLGSLWWVADPLLQMLVYTILVGVILGRTVEDYPLFVLSALIAWKGISSTMSTACTAVTGNERIVRQLAFPRIVLPLARVVSQSWRLVVALVVLVMLVALVWPERLSPAIAWLPTLLAVQVVFLLPFAIVLSAATVFVRDLANLVRHLLRLGLYLSPVLYGLDQAVERLPSSIADVYRLNPLAVLLDGYRAVAYEGRPPDAVSLLLPLGVGLVLLAPALSWFRSMQPRFGKLL